MCDCYTHPCEGCGCSMEIHIGDFCTDRSNVHPFCPKCTKLKFPTPAFIKEAKKSYKVFEDTITRCNDKEWGSQVDGGCVGQKVIILCDDKKAYDISLN